MLTLEQLSRVGKAIMGACVDAEILGLPVVSDYLSTAFDELAREAARVRAATVEAEVERPPGESED